MLRYLSRREGVAERPMQYNPDFESRTCSSLFTFRREIPTSIEQYVTYLHYDPTILSLFKSFTTIYRPIVIQPHLNQTI
jgi:hypothetical protein